MENNTEKKRLPAWAIVLIVFAGVILAICLSCTACAGCVGCAAAVSDNASSAVVSASQPGEVISSAPDGQLGSYTVKIGDSFIAKDYENKDVLVVSYEFTNNDADPQCFAWTISDKAYQNGVQLDSSWFLSDAYSYDLGMADKEITTGTTITVYRAYILSDLTNEVTVTAEELISLDSTKLEKVFTLA